MISVKVDISHHADICSNASFGINLFLVIKKEGGGAGHFAQRQEVETHHPA